MGCASCNVVEIYGSYVHVESLTLAHGTRALRFQTQGATDNVVHYVHIKDVQLAIGSQLSANLQAVHPGHHHVEHHQVGPPVPGLVEGRRPAEGDVDLVTLRPEDALNRRRDQGIVVHDQDAAWPCAHVRISSPPFVRML